MSNKGKRSKHNNKTHTYASRENAFRALRRKRGTKG